jgi:hypothetical protein
VFRIFIYFSNDFSKESVNLFRVQFVAIMSMNTAQVLRGGKKVKRGTLRYRGDHAVRSPGSRFCTPCVTQPDNH